MDKFCYSQKIIRNVGKVYFCTVLMRMTTGLK